MADKSCAGCKEHISREQEHLAVNELGQFYHHECLTCSGCRDILRGPFSLWENSEPLCDRCLDERSPRCAECQYPVSDVKLRTKFGYFHPDCFVCTTCKFPFINDQERNYFNVDGRPYCHRDALDEISHPGVQGSGSFQETAVRDAF